MNVHLPMVGCLLWYGIGHDPESGQLQLLCGDPFVDAQGITGMSIPTVPLSMLWE